MDTRNHRDWEALDRQHHGCALCKQLLVVLERRLGPHFLEVVASAESLPGCPEHDGAYQFVVGKRVNGLAQGCEHRFGQRVEGLGTIQRQRDDAAIVALL